MSRAQAVRSHEGVEPSQEVKDLICGRHGKSLTLEELFVEGRNDKKKFLNHMIAVARMHIGTAFRQNDTLGDPWVRNPKRTDHYQVSMDGSIEQLVYVVSQRVGHRRMENFVRWSDLPPQYRRLTDYWRTLVHQQARYLLLVAAVKWLMDRSLLWYHSESKLWQAAQSLVDDNGVIKREIIGQPGHKRRVKRDPRNVHGRDPGAREDGGYIMGTSIGAPAH